MFKIEFPLENIPGQIVHDRSIIDDAFYHVSISSQLDFDFLQGGCQQRSHVISMMLTKKFRIAHGKIWLFAPVALSEYETRTLFIEDKNKLSPDNIVNWNYHTAPVISVKNGTTTDMLVFDPCLDKKKPIPLDDWLAGIGNSAVGMYTFSMPEDYFFNCKYNDYYQLTNVFDGTFYGFTNPAKDNLSMEKGLAVNDMAMFILKKHIEPMFHTNSRTARKKLQDLRDIFGNATVLDLLFGQNLSGNTENTSYRYVLSNYGSIMKEAKQKFHERLIYWTKFTGTLMES